MADMTASQTSAFDQMNAYLQTLGLNPTDFQQLITDAAVHDYSPTTFAQTLQTTPQFTAAFPEIAARKKNGYTSMTPAKIVQYRGTAQQLGRQYGLPAGFLTNQMISDLISNDVSPDELNGRIVQGFDAVNNAPQDVRDTLLNYYGVDQGHLAAFFLDPTGEEHIKKAVAATQIGVTGTRAGYGLSRDESEMLAGSGVSQQQAATGLGQLAQEKELFGALPGEAAQSDITRSEQLGTLLAPTGTAEQELEKRARQRKAQFGGGGGYSETSGGVVGLGQQ